ncbi:transposase [Streptomyces sp. NPDC001880]
MTASVTIDDHHSKPARALTLLVEMFAACVPAIPPPGPEHDRPQSSAVRCRQASGSPVTLVTSPAKKLYTLVLEQWRRASEWLSARSCRLRRDAGTSVLHRPRRIGERALCTRSTAKGRAITLRSRREHEALQLAEARQETDAWNRQYQHRAGAEGTIAQAVHCCEARRSRYRGLPGPRCGTSTPGPR